MTRYKKKMSEVDWSSLYNSTAVHVAAKILETNICEVIESEAPMLKRQMRKNHKSWVSPSTKVQMADKDTARELARNTKLDAHWLDYRKKRNECSKKLKEDKKKHFSEIYKECEDNFNVKKLYKTAKSQLGWVSGGTPDTFHMGGRTVTKPREVAETQLQFYKEKAAGLKNNLPPPTYDPTSILQESLARWDPADRPKFVLRQIESSEVKTLFKKLGNGNSFGNDMIDATTLKMAADILIEPVKFVINLSIKTATFPNTWRISRLIPLHKGKKSNCHHPDGYRPINLLSVLSKMAEKAVQQQLKEYMDLSEQWNTNHHGYREGHSTLTTLLQMTDILYESTDLNMITAMITIDETSAFDCVPHDLLLRKMSMYNFHKDTTNWFGSYLKYRTNYVTVSGSKSTMLHNDIGVPQGSVLGPLLFTLFINEITETIKDPNCANISHLNNTKLFGLNCPLCGHLPCYADDATYLVTSNDRQHNQDKLNFNLARLKEFLNNNGLTMNEEKTTVTECMVAQKRAKCRGTPPPPSMQQTKMVYQRLYSLEIPQEYWG